MEKQRDKQSKRAGKKGGGGEGPPIATNVDEFGNEIEGEVVELTPAAVEPGEGNQ